MVVAATLLVFLVVLGTELYGFYNGHLFSQHVWDADGLKKLIRCTGWYAASAGSVLLVAPWVFATLAVTLAILLTILSAGPLAVLAPAFLLISSCALGARLLGRRREDTIEAHLLATLLGLAVYIFLMTLLARTPVHYAATWAVCLAIPVLLDLRGSWRRLACWGNQFRSLGLRTWAERAAFALLVFILVMHWLIVLKPDRSADGLAMHLAIPANIARNHAFTFQPQVFVWSVMPMGADWTYSIAYLLGGESAARLLNFAMLLLVLALLYCEIRRRVSRPLAFLLVASFAATPLVQLVTGSLFIENTLAAMILGSMIAIWRFSAAGDRKLLYLAMALAGTAACVKFGALAFLALAVPFAIVEVCRGWRSLGPKPWLACALAAVLLVAAAAPTYAIAWWKTGNPIFPFLNEKLHSPLIDPAVQFQDNEFRAALTWHTPFDLTFHTHLYYEAQDGAFGFQYLLLASLCLFALLVADRRWALGAAAVPLGAAILVLKFQPNARYCYAALPLLLPPFAALMEWLRLHGRWLGRILAAYLIACTALNIYFLPTSGWYQKDFYMRSTFSRAGRDRYIRESAPIRKVIADFTRAHPGAPVFLAAEDDIADVAGDVYISNWHQYVILDQLRRAAGMHGTLELLRKWGVQYFIARKPTAANRLDPEPLRRVLETCTLPQSEFDDFYVALLDPVCEHMDEPALLSHTQSQPQLVLPRGIYDDYDPALWFRGVWTRTSLDGNWGHTISYSGAPGAEVSVSFEGSALTYLHSKGPDRGQAELSIDGVSKGIVDLYAPTAEQQVRSFYCCLGNGHHVAVIRVLGRKNQSSSGQIVDLDAIVVE
ncbi:MAG TPA: glycosyltransferase family 39 protein [Bryobacteraceae bacterium]|nr:glycosyltransferase family 39 protein [Bryobacteraceae bacterium]